MLSLLEDAVVLLEYDITQSLYSFVNDTVNNEALKKCISGLINELVVFLAHLRNFAIAFDMY